MERSDERSEAAVLNMGILGASWIAPTAVITPLKFVKDVRAYALASRDLQKAQKYQSMYKIEKIYNDYAELIADEKVDIIYNSLPNSHHKEWTIRALRAGKHVLCEKPLACNEEEVIEMFQVAREQDRLLLEAYHWRFHPLAAQIEQTLRSGELGKIHKAHAEMRIAILRGSDIRYNYDLGGGSTMDTGCYALSALVFLMETLSSASSSPEEDKQKQKMKDENGEEREEGAEFPFEAVVEKAVATCCYPQIDKHMNAELKLKLRKEKEGEDEGQEDTIAATMRCSIYNLVPSLKFVIEGEAGITADLFCFVRSPISFCLTFSFLIYKSNFVSQQLCGATYLPPNVHPKKARCFFFYCFFFHAFILFHNKTVARRKHLHASA
ncbi:Gfo/Idh/MocA family oxidoreductase, variant 2 [Balamuthia mandrillaris]